MRERASERAVEGLLDGLHQRLRDEAGLDDAAALDALCRLLLARVGGPGAAAPAWAEEALAELSQAGPADLLALAFQRLLARAARAGQGQFFTPSGVAALLAGGVAPGPSERVVDPFSGAGGLLYAAAQAGERWGVERSERLVRLARADGALRGLVAHFLCADALLPLGQLAALRPGAFDAALANPPFGASLPRSALEGLGPFTLAEGRRSAPVEALALERSLELLRPGGRLGIVLPDGVLANPTHAATRRLLAERAQLVAVVGLPADTFEPYGARIKTSALFLRKRGPGEPARPEAGVLLERLARAEGPVEGLAARVQAAFARAPAGPSQAELWARDRWRPEDHAPTAPGQRRPGPARRRLSELVVERREALDPRRQPEALLHRLGLEHVEARTGRLVGFAPVPARAVRSRLRIFRPGDVLFGRLRPELGKVYAAVGELAEGVCTPEFVVLTPRPGLLGPRLLRALLASEEVREAVRGRGAGSTLPRLALGDLLALQLPVPPPEQAAACEAFLEAEEARLRRLAEAVAAHPGRVESALWAALASGEPPRPGPE